MFDASGKKEERRRYTCPYRMSLTIERFCWDQCIAYDEDAAKALQRRSRMTQVDAASRHWALMGHGPLTKTPSPHRLGGVHKRDAHYSSRRGPSRAFTDVPCLIRHGVDLATVRHRTGSIEVKATT